MKKTILTIAVTALITCLITNTVNDINETRAHGGIDRKLKNVLDIVEKYSIYEADTAKVRDELAKTIVKGLDDTYSVYYTKQEYELVKSELMNTYIGIGITVAPDVEAGKVKIIEVAEGEIAEEKGLLEGDYIVAVEGVRYTHVEMQQLVMAVRGENNTTVTLTVEREGNEFDMSIPRKAIDIETVTSNLLEEEIGYVRISQFNNGNENVQGSKDTFELFREQTEALKNQGITSLVIDLRGNHGGSLEVVTKIADYLLPSGVITYTEDKNGKREYFDSDENAINLPMAVLINGESASASEVLSGALRDYKLATLVGEKTFGKGVVQTILPLYDGSGIVITSSRYFTPAGECIHEKGIEPDVQVSMPEDKPISKLSYQEDIQLQKAVEILKNKDN